MTSAVLGVVLAGGQSTRFGSDKALAKIGGISLLDKAMSSLEAWCDDVVIAGRGGPGSIADWPQASLGPLGGIAGGMRYARAEGYEAVLTCGVDSVALHANLLEVLSPAPAFIASQPIIGLWPVSALPDLEAIVCGDTRRSMIAFAGAIGARAVQLDRKPANINTLEDLAEAEKQNGL